MIVKNLKESWTILLVQRLKIYTDNKILPVKNLIPV